LKETEKLTLPNNYVELGFEGWNTANFATITIKPQSSTVTAYNYSSDTTALTGLQGFEIESIPSGSIVGLANNAYTKAYVLFNATTGPVGKVYFGFYDTVKQKILVNGSFVTTSAQGINGTALVEFTSADLSGASGVDTIMYPFKLKYAGVGDQDYYLNVTVSASSTTGGFVNSVAPVSFQKSGGAATIKLNYVNSTSMSLFKLGGTAASAEETDINATTEGSVSTIGKASQDIVDDSGIIVVSPTSNTAADKVAVKIPSKDLKVKAYFGKIGAATAGGVYKVISPVTSAIAVMDTEVTATTKTKNFVTVGVLVLTV